jgi:hypothetical protein
MHHLCGYQDDLNPPVPPLLVEHAALLYALFLPSAHIHVAQCTWLRLRAEFFQVDGRRTVNCKSQIAKCFCHTQNIRLGANSLLHILT